MPESIKCEDVDRYFMGRASFIMRFFHMVSQSVSQWTVSLGGHEAFEGRKGLEGWRNKTWTLHHDDAPAHTSLLVRTFLAKHEMTAFAQSPHSPDLACIFVPEVEIHSERSPISDDTGPTRYPAKRVPEVGKTLQIVYRQWRGVLWRRQGCKLINEYFKKKIRFLFGQITSDV
jgi:hypothetical protein